MYERHVITTFYLTGLSGQYEDSVFELKDQKILIGTNPLLCQIVVDRHLHPLVQEAHCEILVSSAHSYHMHFDGGGIISHVAHNSRTCIRDIPHGLELCLTDMKGDWRALVFGESKSMIGDGRRGTEICIGNDLSFVFNYDS